MSYWSQSQSFYGQQGWTYLNARTTTTPPEGPHLPLLQVASNRSITLGVVTATAAAQSLRRGRGRVIGPAAATASARPLSRGAARTLSPVTVVASALPITPGGTHTDRVPGHFAALPIGHLTTASPGRTIGPRIGHLED